MKPGILVISHGSRDAGWVSLVDGTVAAAREEIGGEALVEAAFLELVEGRLIQDGIDRLTEGGADRIYAVPLFVSSGSTHVDEIGWALGVYPEAKTETELKRFSSAVPIEYGKPMDDAPEVVEVLMDRLRGLSSGEPARESLLLIGHGSREPGFRESWENCMASLGEQLRERGGFGASGYALLQLEDVPRRWEELRARAEGNDILVVPIFLSEGYFTKEVIPGRLSGLPCKYDGRTFMPHAQVSEWVIRQAKEWLAATKV